DARACGGEGAAGCGADSVAATGHECDFPGKILCHCNLLYIAATSISPNRPPDRPFGIVLMRTRVAEIDQDAVAQVFCDKPLQVLDYVGDSAVMRGDDLAQILGFKPRREGGRADQTAEHHRQLSALGIGSR